MSVFIIILIFSFKNINCNQGKESSMELKQDVTHGTWDYPFQVHHTALSDGLSLYPHVHNELEITCITKGQGIFYINTQAYNVKEGDILFVPSDRIHLAKATTKSPSSFFSIVFSPDCFCNSAQSHIYTKYIDPILDGRIVLVNHLNGSESWHKEAWNLAKDIEDEASGTDTELLCQSSLLKLWHLFFAHSIPGQLSPNIRSISLKASIDYIHTHFSEHITVQDLAKIAHMSEGHFSRTFKEYMKISPLNYLIQIRIDESIKLLQKSDLSIGEIAFRCGFNDFSYFCKVFRKKMNCNPHEIRVQSVLF